MTSKRDFVHLHVHTQYSLLDGANRIPDLVQAAVAHKMPAVAITDHGNLFGAIEFYTKARAAGLNPIVGCELYVAPKSRFDRESGGAHNEYAHLIVLAADAVGYGNLIKLVTSAHLEGFYYKPRVDKDLLAKHSQGLIALSGCLRGEVPAQLAKGDRTEAERLAGVHQDIFGRENFFIEIQANDLALQRTVNRELVDLSKRLSIPLAATNDCHYLHRSDARAHDVLLCLQTGRALNDPDRMRFGTEEHFFKSFDEMAHTFGELPDSLSNTGLIADRCKLDLAFDRIHLPHYRVPEGTSREAYLERLAREGLGERLKSLNLSPAESKQYEDRLQMELGVINAMGYAGYFLIVWDIIKFARSRSIPVGPGRGSAAGSLAAYALRITDIDPIRYGLLFERFLNPERVSLPDIDMDFCMDRREEVIRYVSETFGSDHVCQIITFGTMAARAVVRDVGRVLEMPYADVDRVAKLIPATIGITLDEALKAEKPLQEAKESDPRVKELLELGRALEGLARHASTHAAGVVISEQPLTEHVPLYRGAKGEIVTQFPKDDIEKIGLVKFDFLGLRTLTVIDQATRLVNKRRPADDPLKLATTGFEDSKTFSVLASGDTVGVFQLESSGMRDLLVRMQPQNFEDLIAILALYRPGPIGSGMVDDYIKRKRGQTPIVYELPQLEDMLRETYGVIVYQEQVMQIANLLAGFSLGQADLLRRAMGKKKPEEMEKQKSRFVEGAKEKGIVEKKAVKIFDLMAYFAGYGFNKSHSAAYAVITFQTAALKAHYPVEYMAALLSSEMGNPDKIVRFLSECRRMGIRILAPDINESRRDFTVVEEGIRFGLAAIRNVGDSAIDSIRAARESGEPFCSLEDFLARVDLRKVNRRAVESLIQSGALDSTGVTRAQMSATLDRSIEEAGVHQRERNQGQAPLFESLALASPAAGQTAEIMEWDEALLLRLEKESIGFYITSHPLARFESEIRTLANVTAESIEESPDGREVRFCGILASRKLTTTRRGDKMAMIQLEDLHGRVDVIIFPDLYKKVSAELILDVPILLSGILDKAEKGVKIKATTIEALAKVRARSAKRVEIRLQVERLSRDDLATLRELVGRHSGDCPVFLRLSRPPRLESLIAVDDQIRVHPSEQFIENVEQRFGRGSVLLR